MSQRAVQVDMGGVGEWEGQWTDSPQTIHSLPLLILAQSAPLSRDLAP